VEGHVVAAASSAPVDGARISVLGRAHARVASDPDGSFRSGALPAGDVALEIAAPHLATTRVVVGVMAGKTTTVLVSLPPATSRVFGRIAALEADADIDSRGVAARVQVRGPQTAEVSADDTGQFSVRLPVGEYRVRVVDERYLAKEADLQVKEGEAVDVGTWRLRARPAAARVVFADGSFRFTPGLRLAAHFDGSGDGEGTQPALGPDAESLLDELVDLLLGHPEITRIRIEAHWDRSVKADEAQRLTYRQASAVADYLAAHGIARERMMAMGMGAAKPARVPGGDRTQDRRIEIHGSPGTPGPRAAE
jgi:hypothetical protein